VLLGGRDGSNTASSSKHAANKIERKDFKKKLKKKKTFCEFREDEIRGGRFERRRLRSDRESTTYSLGMLHNVTNIN
jgi:hypothetical protein